MNEPSADPTDAELLFQLGCRHSREGRYYAAVLALTHSLRLKPEFPEAEFALAVARQKLFGGFL